MEHPEKILRDAVEMYHSRVLIAVEERQKRQRNAGMFVVVGPAGRIVPDLRVLCLDREQLLNRMQSRHPTLDGALAMFDRTQDAEDRIVVFGVLLPDGGVMCTTLQLREANRDCD